MGAIFGISFGIDYLLLKTYLDFEIYSKYHSILILILILSIIARILIIVYQFFTYKKIKHKMVNDEIALNEFKSLETNETIINLKEYSYLDLDIKVNNKTTKINNYYKKQITKFRDKNKQMSALSKRLILFDYYIKWFAWMMVWKFEILNLNDYKFYYKNQIIDYQKFKLIILTNLIVYSKIEQI